MKVGDLVECIDNGIFETEGIGIVMEPPRLSYDCMPGGDADGETYYIIKVLFPAGIIDVPEEDVEVM
tara:strand:- start:625 stop:825 length:201 start_codon:yes stop_codon:yes gene_type:complete